MKKDWQLRFLINYAANDLNDKFADIVIINMSAHMSHNEHAANSLAVYVSG